MTPEISRRCASLTLASLATLGCVPRLPVVASEPGITPIGVAESKLPKAVIFMRAAELTGLQADMARRSAELTNEERFAQGIVVGRGQATKSIDYLLTNTGLRRLPGGAKPAETLTDVCRQLRRERTLFPLDRQCLAHTKRQERVGAGMQQHLDDAFAPTEGARPENARHLGLECRSREGMAARAASRRGGRERTRGTGGYAHGWRRVSAR